MGGLGLGFLGVDGVLGGWERRRFESCIGGFSIGM